MGSTGWGPLARDARRCRCCSGTGRGRSPIREVLVPSGMGAGTGPVSFLVVVGGDGPRRGDLTVPEPSRGGPGWWGPWGRSPLSRGCQGMTCGNRVGDRSPWCLTRAAQSGDGPSVRRARTNPGPLRCRSGRTIREFGYEPPSENSNPRPLRFSPTCARRHDVSLKAVDGTGGAARSAGGVACGGGLRILPRFSPGRPAGRFHAFARAKLINGVDVLARASRAS